MDSFEASIVAGRSIVVLTVPWSAHAQRATSILKTASEKLESLEITFAIADEESLNVRSWLKARLPDTLGGPNPKGAGSVLWLENGTLVDVEVAGGNLTLYELMVRTRDRWDSSYQNTRLEAPVPRESTYLDQLEDAILKWGPVPGALLTGLISAGIVKDYFHPFIGMVIGGALGGGITYLALSVFFSLVNRKRNRNVKRF